LVSLDWNVQLPNDIIGTLYRRLHARYRAFGKTHNGFQPTASLRNGFSCCGHAMIGGSEIAEDLLWGVCRDDYLLIC
jgi:hypothetical protein